MASMSVNPARVLFARQVGDDINNVKTTFSSWDNCMAKTYCKWPVIAAIIVGSLILLTVLFCVFRCLMCGAECCVCCGKTCCCCGSSRHSRRDQYVQPPSQPYGAYPQQQPQAFTPMMYGAGPGVGSPTGTAVPQYASFHVSKKDEDRLPSMPGWDTAREKKVEIEDDGPGDEHDAIKLQDQKKPASPVSAAGLPYGVTASGGKAQTTPRLPAVQPARAQSPPPLVPVAGSQLGSVPQSPARSAYGQGPTSASAYGQGPASRYPGQAPSPAPSQPSYASGYGQGDYQSSSPSPYGQGQPQSQYGQGHAQSQSPYGQGDSQAELGQGYGQGTPYAQGQTQGQGPYGQGEHIDGYNASRGQEEGLAGAAIGGATVGAVAAGSFSRPRPYGANGRTASQSSVPQQQQLQELDGGVSTPISPASTGGYSRAPPSYRTDTPTRPYGATGTAVQPPQSAYTPPPRSPYGAQPLRTQTASPLSYTPYSPTAATQQQTRSITPYGVSASSTGQSQGQYQAYSGSASTVPASMTPRGLQQTSATEMPGSAAVAANESSNSNSNESNYSDKIVMPTPVPGVSASQVERNYPASVAPSASTQYEPAGQESYHRQQQPTSRQPQSSSQQFSGQGRGAQYGAQQRQYSSNNNSSQRQQGYSSQSPASAGPRGGYPPSNSASNSNLNSNSSSNNYESYANSNYANSNSNYNSYSNNSYSQGNNNGSNYSQPQTSGPRGYRSDEYSSQSQSQGQANSSPRGYNDNGYSDRGYSSRDGRGYQSSGRR